MCNKRLYPIRPEAERSRCHSPDALPSPTQSHGLNHIHHLSIIT